MCDKLSKGMVEHVLPWLCINILHTHYSASALSELGCARISEISPLRSLFRMYSTVVYVCAVLPYTKLMFKCWALISSRKPTLSCPYLCHHHYLFAETRCLQSGIAISQPRDLKEVRLISSEGTTATTSPTIAS